jgi:hypothetical protein
MKDENGLKHDHGKQHDHGIATNDQQEKLIKNRVLLKS